MKPWLIPIPPSPEKPTINGFSPLFLIYGFGATILLGALLLWLPISDANSESTSFLTALFTATSAVCVTGLTVVDTGTHWSGFGEAIILLLIQIGGFGFMTSATLLLMALGRRIGLRERLLIAESMGVDKIGGVVRLVKRIAIFTLLAEAVGAALLYISFADGNSVGSALWHSTFHSISAFNNAGFDIFGSFRSLQDYQGDALVLITTAVLVFLGGIGFIVVADVVKVRRLVRLSLNSKIVLSVTAGLLALGMLVILLTEYGNQGTLGDFSIPRKLLVSFFQSVTPRTAGFTTVDIGAFEDYTLFFVIVLMFIGGASGSTAGGIKVNTFGILLATGWSSIRGRMHTEAFGREFAVEQVYRALTVVLMSLGFVIVVVLGLTITEDFQFLSLFFEAVSAFGTVGLSTGITPDLTTAGEMIIMMTMFVGRLGPLALALMLMQRQRKRKYRYPQETVRIG